MEARDRGYTLYKKGMKYKEIAEKIGVPLNTVKSWATRYWKDGKVATKAKPATKPEVATSPRKAGAPKGNVNAVGTKGGAQRERPWKSLKTQMRKLSLWRKYGC